MVWDGDPHRAELADGSIDQHRSQPSSGSRASFKTGRSALGHSPFLSAEGARPLPPAPSPRGPVPSARPTRAGPAAAPISGPGAPGRRRPVFRSIGPPPPQENKDFAPPSRLLPQARDHRLPPITSSPRQPRAARFQLNQALLTAMSPSRPSTLAALALVLGLASAAQGECLPPPG